MKRRHWVFSNALALSTAGVMASGITACGNGDDTTTITPATDAGSDATKGDGSAPQDGSSDSTTADATDASASDGGDASPGPAYALFVGTDFVNAELSVVSLGPDAVAGNLALQDQDSIAYASGGLGFVLERGLGDVLALSPTQPWTARATIDVNDTADAGSYTANPHAVVVTAGTKAYVARYASNTVAIVDVATGAASGTIDLSAFVAPDDPDGLVDVTDGAYDPTTKRAYLLLQRINQFPATLAPAPDYVGECLTSHGTLVAIDTTTDAVVRLGDAGGGAIDLLGANPQALTPDFAHGRILVAEGGCRVPVDGGVDAAADPRTERGIASVDLASATATWLYQTTDVDIVSSLVLVDATHAYVELGSQWLPWDPTQTALGATPVANFPQAPFYDGAGRIVGLAAGTGSDGGTTWSVVAISTATGALTTIAASPFKSVVPAVSFGVTSALVP